MQSTKAACGGKVAAPLAQFEHGQRPVFRCYKRSLLPSVSRVGSPSASLVWVSHRHNSSSLSAIHAPYGPVADPYAEESVDGRDVELLDNAWLAGREDAFVEHTQADAALNTLTTNLEQLIRVLQENDAFIEQQQQPDAAAELARSELLRAAAEHEGSDGEQEAVFMSPTDKARIKAQVNKTRKERKNQEKEQRAKKAAAAAERAAKRAQRRTGSSMPVGGPLLDAASAAAARQLRREQRRASSSSFPASAASSTASPSASAPRAFAEPVQMSEAVPSASATFNRGGPAGTSTAAPGADVAPSLPQHMDLTRRAALEASMAVDHLPSTSATAAFAAESSSSSSSSALSSKPGSSSALGSMQAQHSPVSTVVAMPPPSTAVPLALSPLAPSALVVQQRHTASTRGARSPRRTARTSTMQEAAPAPKAAFADPGLQSLMAESQGKGNLLSGDEEKELALVVKDLLELEAKQVELLKELQRQPTMEEWCAATGMSDVRVFSARLAQGRQAKNAMVQRNLRLVVSICKKFTNRGMAISDLVSEGIAGLLKGVEKFDGAKGFKFSTYAHWWIRQAVGRAVSDQGRMVRLPVHLHEAWAKIRKAEKSLEAQLRRRPSLMEVAKQLDWEPEKLSEMYEIVRTPRSMDVPVFSEDGAALSDMLEDESRMSPDEAATVDNVKRDIDAMLLELNDREAGVVRMRFGLADGVEHTLDDIGHKYNVTRERIRQIEAKALRRLRALQTSGKGRLSEYLSGELEEKSLAARASNGLRKSS